MARLVRLRDLLKYGGGLLVPRSPASPYRYVEYLIEVALLKKYKFQRVLEIGPGADSAFKYFARQDYACGLVADYNPEVLQFNQQALPLGMVEYLEVDVEDATDFKKLEGKKWDYIICNSLIEHLKDDQAFVQRLRGILSDNGVVVCSTVLHQCLYNDWDRAVGHFRRYSVAGLKTLFAEFSQVEVIQSSILQDLVRPLFFSRIRHLLKNSLEKNNRLFAGEQAHFGKPPYAAFFPVLRFLMPIYLVLDWLTHQVMGGIVFVVAKR